MTYVDRICGRLLRAALVLLCALGTLAFASLAAAETTAETLFQSGLSLMRQAQFAQACPKLAESQQLEPRSGTLISLAFCRERLGKSATAWRHYRAAAKLAKEEGRPKYVQKAEAGAAALLPKLPKLRVHAPLSEGLTVQLDGIELPRSEWSKDIPVDPGHHTVVATAEARKTFTKAVELVAGELTTVVVPELKGSGQVVLPVTTRSPDDGPDTMALVGFTLVGVGAAGTIAGFILGGLTLDRKNTVTDRCDQTTRICTKDGLAAAEDGNALSLGSTIAVIGGLAVAGAGVTLVLLSGGDDSAESTDEAELSLRVAPRFSGAVVSLEKRF